MKLWEQPPGMEGVQGYFMIYDFIFVNLPVHFMYLWIAGGSVPTVYMTQLLHDLIKIYTNHSRLCIFVRHGAVKRVPMLG